MLRFGGLLWPKGRFPVYRADSCRDRELFMEDQTVEVVGQIGQGQFGLGSPYANGAYEQAKPVFLVGEHMLDPGPDRGLRGIGPCGRDWDEFMEELRHLHLGAPAPKVSALQKMQAAYETACL